MDTTHDTGTDTQPQSQEDKDGESPAPSEQAPVLVERDVTDVTGQLKNDTSGPKAASACKFCGKVYGASKFARRRLREHQEVCQPRPPGLQADLPTDKPAPAAIANAHSFTKIKNKSMPGTVSATVSGPVDALSQPGPSDDSHRETGSGSTIPLNVQRHKSTFRKFFDKFEARQDKLEKDQDEKFKRGLENVKTTATEEIIKLRRDIAKEHKHLLRASVGSLLKKIYHKDT